MPRQHLDQHAAGPAGRTAVRAWGRTAPHTALSERRRQELDGTIIAYQVAGVGPPVVLLHGLSGSGHWWRRNVDTLARHYRLHIVDLIGFGESRAPTGFVLDEAAGCLVRWLDALQLKRVSVIGHSMGGLIAAELAADYPERVDRLVLVAAAALPFAGGPLRQLPGLLVALSRLPPSFMPVLVRDALHSGPITLVRATRQLLGADIRLKLQRIRAPVLLVWGARDAVVPLHVGQHLCGYLPQARLAVIPRAGHTPMWDAPEAFNRTVLEFLT